MTPNSDKHNPSPDYLRALLDKIGVSQREAARCLGVSERMFRQYLTAPDNKTYRPIPYAVQFALETWATQPVR